MAATVVTKVVCNKVNVPVSAADGFTALNATDGCSIAYDKPDHRVLLMFKGSAGTATIQQGDALQGVKNLEVAVTADSISFVVVESGAFLNTTGALRGAVLVKGPAGISVCAVAIP